MKIQSLSLQVPTKGCVNNCKYCVSKIHSDQFNTETDLSEMGKRLLFAKENNCNTLILTGTGECLQNKQFLKNFHLINKSLPYPFIWIELQTSGVMLNQENIDFLKNIGVVTISLSLSDMFDNISNQEITGTPDTLKIDIDETCKLIKDNKLNLRLSLNMSSVYNKKSVSDIFDRVVQLNADQITFRKLYYTEEDNEINNWIKNNNCNKEIFDNIVDIISGRISDIKISTPLEILPFGAIKYSVSWNKRNFSCVIDDDCMSRELKDTAKYFILRPNCKLYSKWDDTASLIF